MFHEEVKTLFIAVGFLITAFLIGIGVGLKDSIRPSVTAIQVDQKFCGNDYCRALVKEYIENNRKEDK